MSVQCSSKTEEVQGSSRVLGGISKKNKVDGAKNCVEQKLRGHGKEYLDRLEDYFRDVPTKGEAVKLTWYCRLHPTLPFTLLCSEVHDQLQLS